MIDYYGELKEARKEDDLCFSGAFCIIADSYSNILKGKFDLKAGKYLVDYKGNEIHKTSKSSKTHKAIWDNTNGVDYKYYPRGTANRDLSHANRRAAGLDAAKW